MQSGLRPFFTAFLFAFISLGLPLSVRFLSLFLSRERAELKKPEPASVQLFNSRFYLPALLISILVSGFLFLSLGVHLAAGVEANAESVSVVGIILGLFLFLGTVFLFTYKKGNLDWNTTVQKFKGPN